MARDFLFSLVIIILALTSVSVAQGTLLVLQADSATALRSAPASATAKMPPKSAASASEPPPAAPATDTKGPKSAAAKPSPAALATDAKNPKSAAAKPSPAAPATDAKNPKSAAAKPSPAAPATDAKNPKSAAAKAPPAAPATDAKTALATFALCPGFSKPFVTHVVQKVVFDQTKALSSSSQTALQLAQMADSFATQEVSVASRDKEWAQNNGGPITKHLGDSGYVEARASKDASTSLLATSEGWAKKMKTRIEHVTAKVAHAAKSDDSDVAACPDHKLASHPVTDLLEQVKRCWNPDPLDFESISELADRKFSSVLALIELSETKPGAEVKSAGTKSVTGTVGAKAAPASVADDKPDDDEVKRAAAEDSAKDIAEKKKAAAEKAEESEIHIPSTAVGIIKTIKDVGTIVREPAPPITTVTTTTSTTTLSFENDMRHLLQLLYNYKFIMNNTGGFAKDLELAKNRNPGFSIPSLFKGLVEGVHHAASASLQTVSVLDALDVDADLAYRKARLFAGKAAGAELNARQLFRVFRRQFSATIESANDEYGSALAASYNAKSEERDRVLHEHEVESYILMRIRKKAQVSAANFSRVSTEIRRGLTSFTAALRTRAREHNECTASVAKAMQQWRTDALKQLRKCIVDLATDEEIGAKQNLVDVGVTVTPRILDAVKVLSALVEQIADVRARKPDIPVDGKDLTLVRAWDDSRIEPLVKLADGYADILKARWLLLYSYNSTTPTQHKMLMGMFKRIHFSLHPTTSPLDPEKVSACCGDDTALVELSSKLTVRHKTHLRGRTAHTQQAVLRAAGPVPAKGLGKGTGGKPKDRLLALTRFLDNFVNTGFTPLVQALKALMPGMQEIKGTIEAAAEEQRKSFDRVINSVSPNSQVLAKAVLREASKVHSAADYEASKARIAATRARCQMLDLSVRVAQELTTLSTDIAASAEATVTQTQAMDKLAEVWAGITPHKVHQEIVDIAERRSLRILKDSGIHANISDARVHAIQKQIELLRSSNRLPSSLIKEWFDVIALAEEDANDANGGVRLRKIITDLLPLRANAVKELDVAFATLRNVSETIIADLERRVADRERAYTSKMSKESEANAEAKLQQATLREKLELKMHAVKDLEARLAKNKLDIAHAEKVLKDAKSDGADALSPPSPDELKELSDKLQKHQQSQKEITANLVAARAAVAAQQRKLDSLHVEVEGDEDGKEKAFQDWTKRLEAVLAAVRKALRSTMSKLDSKISMISTFHPPTPLALEKIVGKDLPPTYAVAYNAVTRLTRLIEQATLKIRVANVLRNKLGLAKAYRDSEDLQLELVRIREGMQGSAALRDVTGALPALTQAVETFGDHLHTVLRAQLAASFLHELHLKEAEDKKLTEAIPVTLEKVDVDKAAERKTDQIFARVRGVSLRVSAKVAAARASLKALTFNTTDLEEKHRNALTDAHLQKTATIKEMLSVHDKMERTNKTIPALDEAIKALFGHRAYLEQINKQVSAQLLMQQANTSSMCSAANRVVSSVNNLTHYQQELLGMTKKQIEANLAPCEEAKETLKNLIETAKVDADALEKAKDDLEKEQQKRSDAVSEVILLGDKITEMRRNLRDIAKAQAEHESELEDVTVHSAKYAPLIRAARAEVKKYADRDASVNVELRTAESKHNTAQNNVDTSEATLKKLREDHQQRQREIGTLRESYHEFKTNVSDTEIESMSLQANRTNDMAVKLVKLLSDLREEQIKATDARMAVIRKLTQSIVNAFACTGCKSVDTATVFERPPSDTFVDEAQGEGWAEKRAMASLYTEFTAKAKRFSSMPAPEDVAWQSSAKASMGLAKVLKKLHILRSSDGPE